MTCTGIPFSRAAFVAAASTPLALPVMMDARGGSDRTYSTTRPGSAKCRLPTIAIFTYPAADAFLPIWWMFCSNISRSLVAWRS